MDADDSLEGNDRATRQQALQAMPAEIGLLDEILLHANHGTSRITGQRNDRGLNFLAILLINRSVNSLWRAREDAVAGYTVQSLTLCRAALEDWGTICYAERHPDEIGVWLRRTITEAAHSGDPPRFGAIWRDIGGELGAKAKAVYNSLSLFAHPRDEGLPLLFHADADTTYLHVGGHHDPKALRMCLYFSMSVGQMLLERAAQLQYRVFGDVDDQWLAQGESISERALTFVLGMNAELLELAEAMRQLDQDQPS